MTRRPRCASRSRTVEISSRSILPDGNSGPAGDHFADDLRIHADAHQRLLLLQCLEFRVQLSQFGVAAVSVSSAGWTACAPACDAGAGAGAGDFFQLRADFADL